MLGKTQHVTNIDLKNSINDVISLHFMLHPLLKIVMPVWNMHKFFVDVQNHVKDEIDSWVHEIVSFI